MKHFVVIIAPIIVCLISLGISVAIMVMRAQTRNCSKNQEIHPYSAQPLGSLLMYWFAKYSWVSYILIIFLQIFGYMLAVLLHFLPFFIGLVGCIMILPSLFLTLDWHRLTSSMKQMQQEHRGIPLIPMHKAPKTLKLFSSLLFSIGIWLFLVYLMFEINLLLLKELFHWYLLIFILFPIIVLLLSLTIGVYVQYLSIRDKVRK
ncbi:hypothetical protein [Ktedonospora formicarum]|uniref:hypothetical protein n=1 Tax=Ktedonospora formicarum TaxID=2778364 RepID=UPI001C692DAC|nr:hypothetical protein [Ktedonospora formicarum]